MKRKRCSAFTLIEMLVVMSILVVLGSLSFATYQDMQTTIRLNEYTSVMEENIRRVQREAMLLKREPGEGWIYGLGIDFSEIGGTEGYGEYKVFKWCADSNEYGPPKTTSFLPGYDPSGSYIDDNGPLPIGYSVYSLCRDKNEKARLSGYDIGIIPPKGKIGLKTIEDARTSDRPSDRPSISYILFESVTGRAFFYDEKGWIVANWNNNKPNFDGDIEPFTITIKPDGSSKVKKISVEAFSGKISVDTE